MLQAQCAPPLVKSRSHGQVTAVAAGGISTDASGVSEPVAPSLLLFLHQGRPADSSKARRSRFRYQRVVSHLRDGLFYVIALTMFPFFLFFFKENLYFDTMPTSLGASPFVRKT